VEDEAAAERAKRELYFSQSFAGMWLGKTFDPLSGTIVDNELARLEKQLFEADWAEAKARLGDDPSVCDLRRTPAQRRADALVEMAIRSRTVPADGRRPEPLFSVFVGLETFAGRICELANGTVVTPGALVPWLSDSSIERVVFDGPSRVIDIGVKRRLFTGATRRAVQLRDRECFQEFCDLPAVPQGHARPQGIVLSPQVGLTPPDHGMVAPQFDHLHESFSTVRRDDALIDHDDPPQ